LERRLLTVSGERRNTMTNLTVNRTAAAPAPTMSRWDPFSAMRELMRWDPFREIAPLSSVDRLNEIDTPFEVKETKEGYVFKADVPGIKESDLTINLSGNRLSVSGKREEEKKHESETYFSYERSYGSFTRSFTLPEGIDADKVHASLKDGVLSILVPKKPEAQPKKVAIKAG
jgi:HSP20 family protein